MSLLNFPPPNNSNKSTKKIQSIYVAISLFFFILNNTTHKVCRFCGSSLFLLEKVYRSLRYVVVSVLVSNIFTFYISLWYAFNLLLARGRVSQFVSLQSYQNSTYSVKSSFQVSALVLLLLFSPISCSICF